ncbi:unnamed protein product [Vicia faba]|uniref:SET domain-containing protein n=1 Tax=Vicia faba TaxID=3906 RepID=A0AAV1A8F9_VICFA|nr:unnamed protein product [Vicia faba]
MSLQEGYKVLDPPSFYVPIRSPARKLLATPTPMGTSLYQIPDENSFMSLCWLLLRSLCSSAVPPISTKLSFNSDCFVVIYPPYLDNLTLSRTELDRYLEASQIRERAIERTNNVVGTYNDMRLRVFSKYPEFFPEEVFNIESFKWSFAILFSRMVRLPSMNGKVALVPWSDMLNHNCEVETFLDYDRSSKGIVFTTGRPYLPGEQVFISYGNKSNGELLLSYGFVPKEGTNPSDSVELPLSLKKSDESYKEKLELLRKYGLSGSQCFPLRVTGWPLELVAYAYLVDLRYPEIEEQALQFILDSCESSISKYNKLLQASGSLDLDVTSPKQLIFNYIV